jgi:hypothetical protein
MTMRLEYEKFHDLSQLHDELLAAGFTPTAVEGRNEPAERTWIEATAAGPVKRAETVPGPWIGLTFDREVDAEAVAAIVRAHVPVDREMQREQDLSLVRDRAAIDPVFAALARLGGLTSEAS